MSRKNSSAPAEPRLALWSAAVRGAGVKLTHQRLEIFRELARHDDHPDVETVFRAVRERVPTVSLDTVYRTLWLLHDLGLVATLGPRRDTLRFDINLDPHHHFVCLRCGAVRDLPLASIPPVAVPDVSHLGSVVDARVEVRGVCTTCQSTVPDPGAERHE